ncbi:hypothetical protein OXYTRIMIC_300 [Oxytricha trifallax]|uniref:Uncharacterized protein n=1 Tax=Oxytricha trifallax TaxID=1172189 RepID=A0A073HYY3_9SPIT|nr:hypothetical protein OXYTRIMIC_300 [Oxytricha trifallax]
MNLIWLQQFKQSDVFVAAVLQIEGLTADDFLGYAQQKHSLLKFLPDQCDWLHLDKKWICDILMSLDNDGINSIIYEAKQKRRERLDQTQNLIVNMIPEFAQALSESLNYSGNNSINLYSNTAQKGKSFHLIKQSSQRKRRMKEEIAMRGSKQKYLQENKRMRNELNDIKAHIDELIGYKQLVHQLHDNGVSDGE